MTIRKIYYLLSPKLRFWARKIYFFPIDSYEYLTGKKDKLTPKKGDIFIGSGDFKKQGEHQLHLLKKHIDLQPYYSVLDIGSGIGRTAVSLTNYINSEGKYDGFDVVKKGVDWCKKNITSIYPNFNFTLVQLKNALYTNQGENPSQFRFPYLDNSFDCVFLFSVFTHMKIDEIQHYLEEINRVLKKDGRCLATFFLYNETNDLQTNGFDFQFIRDGYCLMDEQLEEANIAIDEGKLTMMIEKSGLKIERIIQGYWSENSRKNPDTDFQDIVVIKK